MPIQKDLSTFFKKKPDPKKLDIRPWKHGKLFTKNHCVGFLGLMGSGKTVFITSLINHFKNFDHMRLPVTAKKNKKGNFKIIEVKDALKPRICSNSFDYDSFRNSFKKHAWPNKTVQLQEYHACYFRTDRPHTIYDTSFLDIPGERLGDIPMKKKNFSEWSSATLKTLNLTHQAEAGKFLEFMNDLKKSPNKINNDDIEKYLRLYKETLFNLIIKQHPVSPSTFTLTPEGNYIPNEILDESPAQQKQWLLENRFSGLDKIRQFAPLPDDFKEKQPELYKNFNSCYQEYRREIVTEITQALSSCDTLVVLIDLADLLIHGESMINAQDKLLENILKTLKPGANIPELLDPILPGSRIYRVAFVASKADRVRQSDFANLESLLKERCGEEGDKITAMKNQTSISYNYCSAVDITEPDPDNDSILKFYDENGNPLQMEVPALPNEMPPHLPPGKYNFPDPAPFWPGINKRPPKHINLEKIANLIFATKT